MNDLSLQNKYSKLVGKHVLVIGGTSGVGFAVARASLAASAIVSISSSSAEHVELRKQDLLGEFPNAQVQGHGCDLSKDSVEQEIEVLFRKVGQVDHVVFTAANRLASTPVQIITSEKIVAAGQLRFIAPILVAKIGSRHISPGPESSMTMTTGSYAGAICSVTRNLALDLKPVRVNAVSPGLVDTEMWDTAMTAEQKESLYGSQAARYPTGRVAKPEDVAEAYIYLMKDTNTTGQIVCSDSGGSLI
ncbi:oxidoreductase [Penicillium riverlandense]|uniref:oxidoreductase n=1 Tax=Penicillium riverlandense TaxID=1903569 RepID=UPI002547BB54|nr:oxidoreductase [Penicillium riverlandense]KAJ5806686.1 oxidoreductase [Penicillium riverlandense]